jgi:hypothetical protein
MTSQLTHTEFVRQYAAEKNISLEIANADVFAHGLYDTYVAAAVAPVQKEKEEPEIVSKGRTCDKCGCDDYDVTKYYCGELGCGKGYGCRRNKYYYCSGCAANRFK